MDKKIFSNSFIEKIAYKINLFELKIFDCNFSENKKFFKMAKDDFEKGYHLGDCISFPCACLACSYLEYLSSANDFITYYAFARMTCKLKAKDAYKLAFICYFYIGNAFKSKKFIREWSKKNSSERAAIICNFNIRCENREGDYEVNFKFDNAFRIFRKS